MPSSNPQSSSASQSPRGSETSDSCNDWMMAEERGGPVRQSEEEIKDLYKKIKANHIHLLNET